ncbi:MAG: NAD-dependent epimerase/dehydratase family protein, partial [Deltaproteobacteria bacterium]|nr:NAD-dependent epimerase/dehydratase family protein [Deltaproteobacteria bacterium]
MEKESPIYIAGHRGLVGSAIHRRLRQLGYKNLIVRVPDKLDLTRQQGVEQFFDS